MQKIPRAVYFKDGICLGVGSSWELSDHNLKLTFGLPTDHYDFVGPLADVLKGKTLQEVIDILYEPREFWTGAEVIEKQEHFYQIGNGVWIKGCLP